MNKINEKVQRTQIETERIIDRLLSRLPCETVVKNYLLLCRSDDRISRSGRQLSSPEEFFRRNKINTNILLILESKYPYDELQKFVKANLE